jgi:hypothetical protein
MGAVTAKKSNTHLPYESAIPLLVTYPSKLKTGAQTRTCIQMLRVALFIITKVENYPNIQQVDA